MRKTAMAILIIFISIFVLYGCSNNDEASKKPVTEQQKPEMPSSLKSIRSELEKIIPQLEQTAQIMPQELMKNEEEGSQGGEEAGKEKGKQQQGQEGEKSSQETGSDKQQPQGGQAMMDIWGGIKESVKKIHENWNKVEGTAIKEGLGTETRDKFESALEELTLRSDEKKIEESLFAALDVYRYYPDLSELFDSKIPPEFFRIKYEVMYIRDLTGREKWDEAKAGLPNLQTQWEILRRNETLKNEEVTSNTENSINDLINMVEKEKNYLVQIKSSIVMDNLDQIEEKLNNSI